MEQFVNPTSFQNLSLACTELINQQDENHHFLYSIPNTPIQYPMSLSYPPPQSNFSAQPFGHDPSAGAWSDSSMSISSDDETGNLSPIINNADDLMSMLPGILEYHSMDALMPTIDPLTAIPADFNAVAPSPYAPQSQTVETLNLPIRFSSPSRSHPDDRSATAAVAGFVNETPLSLSTSPPRQDAKEEVRVQAEAQDRVAKLPPPSSRKSTAAKKSSRRKSSSVSSGSVEVVKRFPCSVCPRSFARNHDLHRHMRVHTGDKPYVCPCCSKGFARTDALKRHFKVEETCRLSPEVQNMKSGRRHSTL